MMSHLFLNILKLYVQKLLGVFFSPEFKNEGGGMETGDEEWNWMVG